MSCALCDCTAGPPVGESFCEGCGHDASVHHASSSTPVGLTPQAIQPSASTRPDGFWWFALGLVIVIMIVGYFFRPGSGSSNKNPGPTPQTQRASPGPSGAPTAPPLGSRP